MERLARRLLDRRHDRRRGSSPSATRPGSARSASGQLEDRFVVASESCALDIIGAELLREVQPGRARLARRARARDAPGGRVRPARRSACSSTSTSPGPTRSSRAARSSPSAARMGEILAREAPVEADLVISVPDSGQRRGKGLRARLRDPAGRRPDQEPLRGAHVHPARAGAAPPRPADEVQPAARGRARQAPRRRRRLDRARQHDAPDRAHAARRGRDARSTCGCPRRRSGIHATTASTCRRSEEMIAHGRTVEEIARELGRRLARLPVARGRLRGDRLVARDALRRLLHRRVPARGHRAARTASTRSRSLPCRHGPSSTGRVRRFASIAVLVSGSGTNLQAILDQVHGRDGIEVAAVASSKRGRRGARAGAGGGRRDRPSSRPRAYPGRDERDRAMAAWLQERECELVVLAGFMELLDAGLPARRFPAA